MQPIVELDGTLIAVRTVGKSQQILLQATPQGQRLAQLLANGDEAVERQDGFLVVDHDSDVDARLYVLADALIALRWAHPTVTQLVLDLGGEER